MNKLVAMFPGQGSQYVGMAKNLYEEYEEVRKLYKEAEQVLGFDLYSLCCYGPESELQKTENTQPAILAASVAAFRVYQKEGGRLPDFGAGHSLGEITALCCAGVISFTDAIRLVRLRGKLMQEAVPEGLGAMAAVRGIDVEAIEHTCEYVSKKDHIVVVSNYNAPEQTVISGYVNSVEEAGNILKDMGGIVIPLKVSAPFHSPLMESCATRMKSELEQITYHDFLFPIISNVTGEPYNSKEQIIEYLYKQITKPVLWKDTMSYLFHNGVDLAFEFGPKSVLKDLAVINIPTIKAYSFDYDKQNIQKITQLFGKANKKYSNNIFIKYLAVATSTQNNNWDENEYQIGVVKPYKELVKLASDAKENEFLVCDEDVEKGMEYLKKILKTKQVPLQEQNLILNEILKVE